MRFPRVVVHNTVGQIIVCAKNVQVPIFKAAVLADAFHLGYLEVTTTTKGIARWKAIPNVAPRNAVKHLRAFNLISQDAETQNSRKRYWTLRERERHLRR